MEEQALMVRVPEETKTDRDVFPSRDSGGPTQPVGPLPSSSCPATCAGYSFLPLGKKKTRDLVGLLRFSVISGWLRARKSVATPRRGQARPGCGDGVC